MRNPNCPPGYRVSALLVAVLAGWPLPATAAGVAGAAREIRVITLEGSPRERGVKHGKSLRPQILEGIAAWKAGLRQTYKMDGNLFVKKFLGSTDFPTAIRKWTPDLLEEVQGIGEGAGVDFPTMLAYQLLDESWAHGERVAGRGCSSLGVGKTATHPSMVAQNMDLESFRDGFQVLLRIKHTSGLEELVFTQAGVIALNGVNNRGVGVVVNTLSQLSFSSDGLPVAFVIRGILAQDSQEKAVDFVRRVRHASGQNYIIGGPQKVFDYEASAGNVVLVPPPSGRSIAYHTNHPLASDDYRAGYRKPASAKQSLPDDDNSQARFDALKRRIEKGPSGNMVEWIQAALRSRDSGSNPVSCHLAKNPVDIFTFGSAIMVLGPTPGIWVAPGPPDQFPYRRFSF